MNAALLKKRIAEAPRMEPTDVVKLAYQSEFGCGHLLSAQSEQGEKDPVAERLCREWSLVPMNPQTPAATMIGGGFCRLNLASPKVRELSPMWIAQMMRMTAEQSHGSVPRFEQTLQSIRRLAQANEMPFSAEVLDQYLKAYRAQGYPPVSHSAGYKKAYAPAYRVVLSDFAALLPVLAALPDPSLMEKNPKADPLLIVLDGDCGAGKTTLSNLLAALCKIKPIRMDDFFLPYEMRTPQRLREPGGNVHYERFQSEVLNRLPAAERFSYLRFDCATGKYIPQAYQPACVAVIEGSYSHHPAFREAYERLHALRVFVEVDAHEQLRRLALRNADLLPRFQNEWIPLEKNYFEAYDIKKRANIALQSEPWEETE
ncbi:MAG: hypothetical protein RR946_09800 [Clostridia bacterium]